MLLNDKQGSVPTHDYRPVGYRCEKGRDKISFAATNRHHLVVDEIINWLRK